MTALMEAPTSTTLTNPTPATTVAPTTRVMNAVRAIVRATNLNSRWIEQRTGMSLAQLVALQELAERPATSLNELAARTGTHQSSVSVVVTRLVERGYVRRSPVDGDRRMIQVEVTDAGREVVRNAPPTVFQQLNEALNGVPADQMAAQMERWLQSANIEISATGDNA